MGATVHHRFGRPAGEVPAAWDVGAMILMIALVLVLPPAIFGALTYYRFGVFSPSYYVPYEEFRAAMTGGDAAALFAAPLLSVNMTSGDILANMYSVTLGQYALSIALGTVMGLTLAKQLYLRRTCPARTSGGTAAAAGTGLFATVAASSTGILGCCGSGLAGGVLTLMGVSGNVAGQLADASLLLQAALIGAFVLLNVRLATRLKTLAFQGTASLGA